MGIFQNIKKVLLTEDTISQQFVIEKMKEQVEYIKAEYEKLINLQEDIKNNPKIILDRTFEKKEKYIELMDNIKYKDINLIKDYEIYAMRYNILVELYNKFKKYMQSIDEQVLVNFETDKYKQPVAIVSHNLGIINKIVLIKNTFNENDYIKYKIDNEIEILEIKSHEQNVNHGTFMINMLFKTIEKINQHNKMIKKIKISDEMIKQFGTNNCIRFFKKFGFEIDEKGIVKTVKT